MVIVVIVGLIHVELCQRSTQILLFSSTFFWGPAVWQSGGFFSLWVFLILIQILFRLDEDCRLTGQVQTVPVAQLVIVYAHALLLRKAVGVPLVQLRVRVWELLTGAQ